MAELKDHSTRDHALLNASSAERWLNCTPSALAAEAYPSEATEFTLEGTLAHEVAEAVLNGEEVTPSGDITFEMLDCANSYDDYIKNLIHSPDAVVLTEQQVDFSPWVPEGFGTCDCIILQDNTLTVVDFKYGMGVPVSAEDNPQLRLYALGALNDYGDLIDVEVVEMHIVQPRIENYSYEVINIDALKEWGESIKPIAERAYKGEGEYVAGKHCKFCPHAGHCRKLNEVCTTYITHNGHQVAIPKLAPFELAGALQMEPLITLWLKRVKEQAFKDAINGEKIPGYKLVQGKMGNRKWSDESKVLDALKNEDISPDSVTETKILSPAQVEKLIGKKKFKQLLNDYTTRAPGAPSLVADTDPRPEFDSQASIINDFTERTDTE